jgi:hypothetical protein
LSSLVPLCFVLGEVLGTFAGNWVHPKPILIATATIGAAFVAAVGANPLNLELSLAFLIGGCFFVGAMDGVAITMSTLPLDSQEELGTAGGFSGAMRNSLSAIATVIYSTILSNRLASTIPANVYPAAINAGLPVSSLESLVLALDGTISLSVDTIPGLTSAIIREATDAYKLANAQAYRTVFLSTLGFGLLGVILVWFSVGVPVGQENFVAAHIHKRNEERQEKESI